MSAGIEDLEYRGGVIKVRRSGDWKAIVYAPAATQCEAACPTGEDRDSVIAEAKRIMDARISELA